MSGFWGASNESAVCASTARRGARGAGHGDRSEIQTVESQPHPLHTPRAPREARRDFSHLAILESPVVHGHVPRSSSRLAPGLCKVQTRDPEARQKPGTYYSF